MGALDCPSISRVDGWEDKDDVKAALEKMPIFVSMIEVVIPF